MKHNIITTAETRLPSAPILPNPILCCIRQLIVGSQQGASEKGRKNDVLHDPGFLGELLFIFRTAFVFVLFKTQDLSGSSTTDLATALTGIQYMPRDVTPENPTKSNQHVKLSLRRKKRNSPGSFLKPDHKIKFYFSSAYCS